MKLFYGTFLFKRMVFVVALALIISILNPMLTKLQGQSLNVLEVVVLSWSVLIGSILQIMLKKTDLRILFISSIIIELFCFISIYLYFFDLINIRTFLYSIVFLEALIMFVNGALGIRIRALISVLYQKQFKDFEFSSIFISNITLLIGGIFIFFVLMYIDLKTALLIASNCYIFMIFVEIYQMKDVLEMEQSFEKNKDFI